MQLTKKEKNLIIICSKNQIEVPSFGGLRIYFTFNNFYFIFFFLIINKNKIKFSLSYNITPLIICLLFLLN